jgi:hypothetical protein
MQKVSSRDLRSEEGKYLPFDPTLSKMTTWLTSLPAFQISPLSRNSGREIQESLQLFQHLRVIHSGLPGRLHRHDSSRVCSSTEALETSEPLSRRSCACRSDPCVTAASSCGAQRDNQGELDARAQCTYIQADALKQHVSIYMCSDVLWREIESWQLGCHLVMQKWCCHPKQNVCHAIRPTRHRSIRAPPKKDREKTLVDPDVHSASTRRANSVLVLALCE